MANDHSKLRLGLIFGGAALCLGIAAYRLSDMRDTALVPNGPVVGDVTYWKEGADTKARVITHGAAPTILEGLQGSEPVTGILITTLHFAECGVVKFQRQTFGSAYAAAQASDAAKHSTCPIKDWSGVWRIGRIGA